jgi:hypothetical protein
MLYKGELELPIKLHQLLSRDLMHITGGHFEKAVKELISQNRIPTGLSIGLASWFSEPDGQLTDELYNQMRIHAVDRITLPVDIHTKLAYNSPSEDCSVRLSAIEYGSRSVH